MIHIVLKLLAIIVMIVPIILTVVGCIAISPEGTLLVIVVAAVGLFVSGTCIMYGVLMWGYSEIFRYLG